MKAFLRRHKTLNIWLIAAGGTLLLFYLVRDNRAIMTFWVDYITNPLKEKIAMTTHLVPFSLAEFILLTLIAVPVWLFVREIRKMRKTKSYVHGAYRVLAGLMAILLSVVSSFSLLYGANYYADGFQERSGIFAQDATVEDLRRVTALFAQGLNETAPFVERDEDGVFSVSIRQIFGESVHAFRNIEGYFPFLAHRDYPPKPLILSLFMQYTDYVGFFFPYTAEANINVLAPRSQVPVVVLHEFVHQRGIASEDEANFVAILAGIKSENPIFAYSAYLMGYSYLANALHRVSPESFRETQDTLNDYVRADLADIRAYHDRKNPTAQHVTNAANDRMLRTYGEESGIRSYGEVVDLLIVYF